MRSERRSHDSKIGVSKKLRDQTDGKMKSFMLTD